MSDPYLFLIGGILKIRNEARVQRFIFFFILLLNLSVNAQEYIITRKILLPPPPPPPSSPQISSKLMTSLSSSYSYYAKYDFEIGASPLGVEKTFIIDVYGDPRTISQPIGVVSISGSSDFYIKNDGCTGMNIPNINHCYIEVAFKPSINGLQFATVSVPFSNLIPQPNGNVVSTIGRVDYVFSGWTDVIDLPHIDTIQSCLVAANSQINIDNSSLEEQISIVGSRYFLFYSSALFKNNSKYNPKNINLGGWSLNDVHHYDPGSGLLFMGSGDVLNVAPNISDGKYILSGANGAIYYEFDAYGKHLQTRDSKTNLI